MLELVVIKLNDVGALLGKQGGHLDELARSIRQLDLEVHDAAAGDHTFLNHRTHGHGVDIAAGHNRNHHVRGRWRRRTCANAGSGVPARPANGAGRLDHQLVLLEHEQNHFVDIALGDGDQIVQELVNQSEGQVAGCLTATPSAEVTTWSAGDTRPAASESFQAGEPPESHRLRALQA